MSTRTTVLAPAKVNLALRVLGRRSDGYHDIDTLFQAVDLCDALELEVGGDVVELEVDGPDLGPIETNLAYRAATAVLGEAAPGLGVRIRLTKRIPVGAGLGGGSSDAAAVLRGLGRALDFGGTVSLGRFGAELGSDVPFFLGESPLARGTGRGDVLDPIAPLPSAHLVLVSPPVRVATAAAYAALSEARAGQRSPARTAAPIPSTWEEVDSLASNDFEAVISTAHAEVRRALEGLRSAGASAAIMTGSGSTCFGRFSGPDEADGVAAELSRRLGFRCQAVRTLRAFPAPTSA